MRFRELAITVAVVVAALFVAALFFAIVTLQSDITQQPTISVTGSADETTTPPATPPPETSPLSSVLDGITGLISDLVLLGALVLGAFLVVRIFYRLRQLLRARQIVVENLANSSGSDDITKSLTGLSQLTREELVRQLREVRLIEVDENAKGGGANSAHVRRSAPLTRNVTNALDGTLDTLLESLKGVAPDRIK
jgi:hypothetical protein